MKVRAYLVRPTADTKVVERVAKHLKSCNLPPLDVWHSRAPEAAKMAEIIAAQVGRTKETVAREELGSADAVDGVANQIKTDGKDLLLIAEQPVLHKLTAAIINHPNPRAFREIPPAGFWEVSPDDKGVWHVTGSCSPEQITA